MKKTSLLILAAFCGSLLSSQNFAEAPVVDESENFALLGENQADNYNPDKPSRANYDAGDEKPLAHDSIDTNTGDSAMMADKLQGLQQEVQELRGQLEVQSHELKKLQDQQLAFYKDLDSRLSSAPAIKGSSVTKSEPVKKNAKEEDFSLNLDEKTGASAVEAPSAATAVAIPVAPAKSKVKAENTARSNPADEQISYMAAYELIKNNQYDAAITSMEKFCKQYPSSGFTANAQYWLGELYMIKKDYAQSIQHFDSVLQQFPSSTKAAASMLKIGYALAASGRPEEAKQRLRQVIKNYPDSNTAQLAKAKLEILDA